jgi:hypothetical protein
VSGKRVRKATFKALALEEELIHQGRSKRSKVAWQAQHDDDDDDASIEDMIVVRPPVSWCWAVIMPYTAWPRAVPLCLGNVVVCHECVQSCHKASALGQHLQVAGLA